MEHIPVLMFTVRSDKEDVVQAMKAGVDSYITKSFTPVQLRAKLQSLSGRRSKRQVFQVTNGAVKTMHSHEAPLIVLAETVVDPHRLNLPDNQEILSFLYRSTTSLNLLNSRREGPPIGYLLPTTTNEVTNFYAHISGPHKAADDITRHDRRRRHPGPLSKPQPQGPN
jgi:hypothetical protein